MKNEKLLEELVLVLREELMESGEFLARMDDLRRSSPTELTARTRALEEQRRILTNRRSACNAIRQRLAEALHAPNWAGFAELAGRLPTPYAFLLSALVEENDDLLRREKAAQA